METLKTKVGEATILCEKYTDIYEFRDTLVSRKLNDACRDAYDGKIENAYGMDSATRKNSHVYHQYGTLNFEEADTYLTDGYEEGVNALSAGKLRPTTGQRIEYKTDFVGHRPSIGNVVRNMPKQMIRTVRKPAPINEVELVYYNCAGWDETAAEIGEAARKFLDAAYAIEQQGTRVGITILSGSTFDGNDYLCAIRVKKPGQSFNLRKLSYPLCHPSFFRRHIFRWYATTPIITDTCFASSYGGLSDTRHGISRFRQFLIDARVISDKDICVSYRGIKYMTDGDEVVKEMARQNEAILAK